MRLAVLVLLLANLGFFAWTQGWLDAVTGVPVHGEREPERLSRQVRPELVRVLDRGEAAPGPAVPASATTASPAPATAPAITTAPAASPACLQAGPFAPADIGAAEVALQAAAPGLVPGRYASLRIEQPGVWLVYMGRFAGTDELRQKEAEVGRLHLPYEALAEPAELAPGLVLGRYASKAGAEAGLAALLQRGVRTARVAALAPPSVVHLLRVERVDAGLERQLRGLAEPPFAARRFEACNGLIAALGAASAPASAALAR